MSARTQPEDTGHDEPHREGLGQRLNWLRAGVLGANDGIVSTAGIVVGVAGATTQTGAIVTAGVAGLFAGAMSMAVGEYVSVSTQRDTERAMLDLERRELAEEPAAELEELTRMYEDRGLSRDLAERVAAELTDHDALAAHAALEFRLDPDELTNPWYAALASFLAFTVGALLPLLAITLVPAPLRIVVTFAAVVAALALTGSVSARLGKAPRGGAVWRNVLGGAVAMAVTYGVGTLLGSFSW
ncbi:MAG: VIT family protein [Streptosporangiales bacterium]|nr:VIT family protein [Streptosporangiales bacterium]